MRKRNGLTLVELVVVAGIIGIVTAIALPGLLGATRASHERSASAALRSIATAQTDFRTNDRDGNHANDYWTGDLFALYALIPVPAGESDPPSDDPSVTGAIRLIESSLAAADGATCVGEYGNVQVAATIITGSPKAGYLFRSFAAHGLDGSTSVSMRSDTDGADFYGAVHDARRYAVAAFPESLTSGRTIFLTNQDGAVYKYVLPGSYACAYTPVGSASDSATAVTGTGQSGLDNASIYPAAPASIGCSKLD
jgi:prepilin-type N-terminal cleavage/methylation domain-containing protein